MPSSSVTYAELESGEEGGIGFVKQDTDSGPAAVSRAGTQRREGLMARGTAWRSSGDAGQKQLERQTFGKAGRTADTELGLCKVRAEALSG